MLAFTVIGVYLLLRDTHRRRRLPPPPWPFPGLLLLGWGVFNLVEGLLDHHLLSMHRVRDLPVHVPAYDLVFLGIGGIGLMAIG